MKPTFVVLTDLSPSAERAAHLAALLAESAGAELVLLHLEAEAVVEPEFGLLPLPAHYLDRQERDTVAALAALGRQLAAPVRVQPNRGGLHDTLQTVIRHQAPLLLVLGLAPESDLIDQLLYNYALPVLRETHLPLLLVPVAAHEPALPRQVALAIDGEPFQLSPASCKVAALVESWQAEYTVVHVVPPDGPTLNMHDVVTTAHDSGLLSARVISSSTYQLRHAVCGAGLVQAVGDTQAELLVLVARPRSFLDELFHRSATAEVLPRSPVPVLVLPAAAVAAPSATHLAVDGLLY
ncbi:universal stress protein [Hymenobacter jeollabukensis]|uniref:Universal stress protein n=1 Tax=Hymenobacter jeollabukensis TaxID=2025313 RepID=A0A5R8WWD7_9BACT|nr:universal stress protein [Hymenobacter jeollabukensis]TLM96474.1 universal stress protein [Hymenobacter jeollabukensis]